jgi:hypothetical protein
MRLLLDDESINAVPSRPVMQRDRQTGWQEATE